MTDAGASDGLVQESSPMVVRSRKDRIMRGIYNPDKKTFIGRTCTSWAQIFVFYVIYYICLALFAFGFMALLLNVFMDDEKPNLTGAQSLLRTGPSLGIFPFEYKPNSDGKRGEYTIIRVSRNASSDRDDYLKRANKFLDKLTDNTNTSSFINCDSKNNSRSDNYADLNKMCKFDVKDLGLCANPKKALDQGVLCVYARINRIYGWLPDVEKGFKSVGVQCGHNTVGDKENAGTHNFAPSQTVNGVKYGYFPHVFFPYLNQESKMTEKGSPFKSPVVAIEYSNTAKSVPILLKCFLVGATNIDAYQSTFEIIVD